MSRYPGGGRGLLYRPPVTRKLDWASPEQEAIFRRGPAPTCASGGFGAGKTLGFTRKILLLMDLYPGYRVVIFRRVWDELKKTTMSTFFKDCPPDAYNHGGRRSDVEKILRLNPRMCEDGVLRSSEILWLYLDDPEIETILRGLEFNAFLGDQMEEIAEEFFDIMLSRMGRWDQAFVPPSVLLSEKAAGRTWPYWNEETGLPLPPAYAMLTCNPDTELHWIWRRFHEDSPEWRDKYRHLGYRMFHMKSTSNKFLPQQNRDQLMQQGKAFVDRFVEGKWGISEGQIHHVSDLSVVDGSPEILQWLKNRVRHWYRVMDHGDSSPTCVGWCGADDEGNEYIALEYYRPKTMIVDHRVNIRDITLTNFGDSFRSHDLADPSIFDPGTQRQGKRAVTADEYKDTDPPNSKDTVIHWFPADNQELGTRAAIDALLRIDPRHTNPFTKELGSPHLFFIKKTATYSQGCDFIIRETRAQRREKIGTVDGEPRFSDDRDEEIPDHGYDIVRYFVAARPALYRKPDPKQAKRWTANDIYRWNEDTPAGGLWRPGLIH